MISYLLIATLLAQSEGFVAFEVCKVDHSASPWEARPSNEEPIFVRPSAILYIRPLPPGTAGIICSIIASPAGSQYVIGAREEVARRLMGVPPPLEQ